MEKELDLNTLLVHERLLEMCELGVGERSIFDFVGRGFFRPVFALVVKTSS